MGSLRVLVVDDEIALCDLLRDALSDWGFDVATALTGADALTILERQLFDVVLLDVWMREMSGLALLGRIKGLAVAPEVVMMTGLPSVDTAVAALKTGAYDYLVKPLVLEELRLLLERISDHRFLRREVDSLRRRLAGRIESPVLVGSSLAMERLRELVRTVAATDSPVIVEGETGTGKETVALAIHWGSARAKAPFIPVHCGAIPANLAESEFFGHVRGAFSGALYDALGLCRSAHGGTLFLKELSELPPTFQSKLLRVLAEGEVQPIGSQTRHAVDVRVIVGSTRQPPGAVAEGRHGVDLLYGLDVVRLAVPPLRERREDLPALVTHFLRRLNHRFGRDITAIRPEALEVLTAYEFPANVRELENMLERAYVMGARQEIRLADISGLTGRPAAMSQPGRVPTLAEVERELILRALELYGNDKEAAARALEISPRTIYRRLKEYGIE
jgi:DNA-binding NtrC family response regulator